MHAGGEWKRDKTPWKLLCARQRFRDAAVRRSLRARVSFIYCNIVAADIIYSTPSVAETSTRGVRGDRA